MDAKAGLIVSQNGYVQRATYYTIVFDSGAHTAGLPLVNLGNESIQGQRGTWADWPQYTRETWDPSQGANPQVRLV